MSSFLLPFNAISMADISKVGGKNASLGEMVRSLSPAGIRIPKGFALSADAYKLFMKQNNLEDKLRTVLNTLDLAGLSNLHDVGIQCRTLVSNGAIPPRIKEDILEAYRLIAGDQKTASLAVRSSATAEDMPKASFAGQHDSFLNISDENQLVEAVHKCYVSLFNDRAIKYRTDNGFDHMSVFISVGIQLMVRSDKASAGVAFTIDPESGNENIIYITSSWGLGEALVQGVVTPDEYYFFKPALHTAKKSQIYRRLGAKANMIVFSSDGNGLLVKTVETPELMRERFSLSHLDALQLALWCDAIERHYKVPMDIEWAKDGNNGCLYILQARPETVHSQSKTPTVKEYKIHPTDKPLCAGKAVGKSIVSGRVCLVKSMSDAHKVKAGDIIVADMTNPDWNTMLKRAVSIVTNKGGRTSHASIVARELGIPAVVGTVNATESLRDGQEVTVCCSTGDSGYVYNGKVPWEVREWSLNDLSKTTTRPMLILSDPDKALSLAAYPNEGVGLMRMEFVINSRIQVHPMALVKYRELPESAEKKLIDSLCRDYSSEKAYFVDKLSESIAMVAAAFYPKEVIVRMSDFKTNEYAMLIGGNYFEPHEENPMLGFRGASRYYHEKYKEAFGLECQAIRVVREDMELTNVKVMIPFCRTVNEGKKVLEVMKEYGLEKGKKGLEVYVMAEIPSNVILADQFAKIFDGFSIGSNDLTQLTLGLDRDSAIVNDLFDENNEAVKALLSQVIAAARKNHRKIGLCGQAPSDFPQFSRFLVEQGIDSISFNPDALIRGIENIMLAERSADKANGTPVPEARPSSVVI